MAKIKQPGVEVAQELITTTATVATPNLSTVIVGPCYQIVKALDDNNKVQTEAFAGSYENGAGTIAYDLPNLKTGAEVVEDSIQVYLTAGSSTRLKPPKDEEVIFTGSGAGYVYSSGVLTDSGEDFTAEGVLTSDVVRLTFRGEVVDFPITAVGTTTLTLTDQIEEDLTGVSFEVVRNPAEFAYQGSAINANYQFGDETNYITISAKGDYVGAAGDALNLEIDAGIVTSQTSGFYSGTYLFTTSGSGLAALTASTDYLVFDLSGTNTTVHQIQSVISDKALGLATTLATSTSKNWAAGEAVYVGPNVSLSTTSNAGTWSGSGSTSGATTVVIVDATGQHHTAQMNGTAISSFSGTDATYNITAIIKNEVNDTGNGGYSLNKGAAANLPSTGIAHTTQTILLESVSISKAIANAGTDLTNKIMAVASGLSNRQTWLIE